MCGVIGTMSQLFTHPLSAGFAAAEQVANLPFDSAATHNKSA
jgi:hypothetical protein